MKAREDRPEEQQAVEAPAPPRPAPAPAGAHLTPQSILALQRGSGNAAVSRMIVARDAQTDSEEARVQGLAAPSAVMIQGGLTQLEMATIHGGALASLASRGSIEVMTPMHTLLVSNLTGAFGLIASGKSLRDQIPLDRRRGNVPGISALAEQYDKALEDLVRLLPGWIALARTALGPTAAAIVPLIMGEMVPLKGTAQAFKGAADSTINAKRTVDRPDSERIGQSTGALDDEAGIPDLPAAESVSGTPEEVEEDSEGIPDEVLNPLGGLFD
jgi:hypothetical protein